MFQDKFVEMEQLLNPQLADKNKKQNVSQIVFHLHLHQREVYAAPIVMMELIALLILVILQLEDVLINVITKDVMMEMHVPQIVVPIKDVNISIKIAVIMMLVLLVFVILQVDIVFSNLLLVNQQIVKLENVINKKDV